MFQKNNRIRVFFAKHHGIFELQFLVYLKNLLLMYISTNSDFIEWLNIVSKTGF